MPDRLLRPPVRVLDEANDLRRVTGIKKIAELAQTFVHARSPRRRLPIVDEPAASERLHQPPAPIADVYRFAARHGRPNEEPLTKRLVLLRLLNRQLDEARSIETREVGTNLINRLVYPAPIARHRQRRPHSPTRPQHSACRKFRPHPPDTHTTTNAYSPDPTT